jgi:hypothetical protein
VALSQAAKPIEAPCHSTSIYCTVHYCLHPPLAIITSRGNQTEAAGTVFPPFRAGNTNSPGPPCHLAPDTSKRYRVVRGERSQRGRGKEGGEAVHPPGQAFLGPCHMLCEGTKICTPLKRAQVVRFWSGQRWGRVPSILTWALPLEPALPLSISGP